MSHEIIVQRQPRTWLDDSVLRPFVSRYGAYLHRGRYATDTQRVYLCCVAHFAHWVTEERYMLSAIGESVVARFLSEHIPACDCPYPVHRLRHEMRAALAILLEVLNAEGVEAPDPALATAIAQELARFDAHMRDVWGLADSTRLRRTRVIREFLLAHFADQPVTMSTVSAAAVRRFVLGGPGRSAGSIAVIGGAVGCYLRFRSMSGDRVSALAAAIPRAAHWRLASLPEVLTDAEVDELLRSFDQPFPSRRRAYAMTRCLIDLGLRSSEVVNLRLEDINWGNGTISFWGRPNSRVTSRQITRCRETSEKLEFSGRPGPGSRRHASPGSSFRQPVAFRGSSARGL